MPTKPLSSRERVRVVVRVRPLSRGERADLHHAIVHVNEGANEVCVGGPSHTEAGDNHADERARARFVAPRRWTFDRAYGPRSSQDSVFEGAASSIVDAVLQGFNGTIFAYGQTGSGKTYTMQGTNSEPGIIPRAFGYMFDRMATGEYANTQFVITASYLEIINGSLRDLLPGGSHGKLKLATSVDGRTRVAGLKHVSVGSVAEILRVLEQGAGRRTTASTHMNDESSRSHAIFSIAVEACSATQSAEPASNNDDDGESKQHTSVRRGVLRLVDLAGSERIAKTKITTADRTREACSINLSLAALGNVISALTTGKPFVPYRNSILTKLLHDSLGGTAKTVMIANVGPASYNEAETVNTLKWAARAKEIKNRPKIHQNPKDALLQQYQAQITKLQKQLAAAGSGSSKAWGSPSTSIDGTGPQQDADAARAAEELREKLAAAEAQVEKAREDMAKQARDAEARQQELLALNASEQQRLRQLENDRAEHEETKAVAAEKAAEAQLLAAKLKAQEAKLQEHEKQQRRVHERLADMQSKLLLGGKLLDKAARQEAELRAAKVAAAAEAERRRQLELDMARQQEEASLMLDEQYGSMADELSANAKKLRLCRKKLQAARREIKQLQEDYDDERATYLKEAESSQNREANFEKELGLLRLIVDGFVPPRFQQQIRARATFDEVTSSWHLPELTLAGNHASAQAVTGPTPRRQRLHGRGVDLNLPMDVHVASTKKTAPMRAQGTDMDALLSSHAVLNAPKEVQVCAPSHFPGLTSHDGHARDVRSRRQRRSSTYSSASSACSG